METPKYAIVQDWIKNEINKGTYKNGDKILSENELMEKFNFSRQTIRLAISNLENQGLLERIKGSGTYVNIKEVKASGETNNVGVILSYIDSYIYPEIIKGIEAVLAENGYNMTLGITYNKLEKETAILNSLINKNVDGIIVEGCKTAMPNPNKEIYENIKKTCPCVFIHGCYPNMKMPLVTMNDVEGGFIATNHLIEMGHKNIAAIMKSDDIQGHKRYEGYINALRNAKLTVNDQNIMWFTSEDLDLLFESTLDSIFFRRLSNCSAILCYNDQIALRVIEFLKANNIKPFEQVSIVSFDNSKTAEVLGLTSVNHLKSGFGTKVAEAFIKQIKTGETTSLKIKPELVIRNSVKKRNFVNSWENPNDMLFEE